MSTIAVVINPESGSGHGLKVWGILKPRLEALFDTLIYRLSEPTDELRLLTRMLLDKEPDYLLIIGGDGSINHALNGFVENDRLISPQTKIAFFNAGCGGDFSRQFPEQRINTFLEKLVLPQFSMVNIGKIILADQSIRYFINIASCGLSAQVASSSLHSRWLKKLGGTVNYMVHSLIELISYKSGTARIQIDDQPAFETSLLMLAVCNGQYFGGKMHVAPMAKVDDDLLEIVLFHDFTKFEVLTKMHTIYSAKHLNIKNVEHWQAKKITIEPLNNSQIRVEADGESVGQLPVSIELLEQRLPLII